MTAHWIAVIGVVGLLSSASAARFGDSLQKCDVQNKQALNSCLLKIVQDLRPFMSTGIPEINVQVLEPMLIPRIDINQGGGLVTIKSTFTQVQVRGISNYQPTVVSADPDSMTLTIGMKIPELRITGNYEINGNVFALPVRGTGTFWNIMNGVTATGVARLAIQGKAPKEFLRVANGDLDFTVDKMRMRLNNLFNGDNILGETVNNFLNENGQEVLQEVKPEVSKQINTLIMNVMNDALSALPVEKFLQGRTRRS